MILVLNMKKCKKIQMKMLAILIFLLGLLPQVAYSGFVKGHFRKNGTYVQGYYRRSKGSGYTSSSIGYVGTVGNNVPLSHDIGAIERPNERVKQLFGFDVGEVLVDRSKLQKLKDGSFKKKMKLKLKSPFDVWREVWTYYTRDDYLLFKLKMVREVRNPDEEKMQQRMNEIVGAIQQKFFDILTLKKCDMMFFARFSKDVQQQMSVGIEKGRDADGKPTASFVFSFEDKFYLGDQSAQ